MSLIEDRFECVVALKMKFVLLAARNHWKSCWNCEFFDLIIFYWFLNEFCKKKRKTRNYVKYSTITHLQLRLFNTCFQTYKRTIYKLAAEKYFENKENPCVFLNLNYVHFGTIVTFKTYIFVMYIEEDIRKF